MVYSAFKKRPALSYLLLGLVFVIGVTETALAGIGVFPDNYDWVIGCMLFVTTIAWMGAAALAGMVAPISSAVMKWYYVALIAFLVALTALLATYAVLYEFFDAEPWVSYLYGLVGLTIWVWMFFAGLAGSLAPRDINAKVYVPLVILPLLSGIVIMVFLFQSELLLRAIPWIGWEYVIPPLYGLYGLVTSLLFRGFLSRLKWTRRLQSNLLFVPVAASALALTILVLWGLGWIHWVRDLRASALFVVVMLAPLGIVTLRTRDFRVSVAALGITMASYCVIAILTLYVGFRFLQLGGLLFMYILAGIVITIPAGYLISGMKHPYRNVLVASIGPGLLTLMFLTIYLHWFVFPDNAL